MTDTGCALESPAMRSSGAATGTRTTMRACSISTTTGLTTTTTISASADPTLQHLDAGHAATEGSILVESIPQDPAKARQPVNQPHAKPTAAAAPAGTVAGRGNRITQFNELIVYALDNLTPKIFARRLKRGMYSIENNELQKYCNRCKEYWPADSEFFLQPRLKLMDSTHGAKPVISSGATSWKK